MVNIDLLKKLTFIADKLQYFGDINFIGLNVNINDLLDKKEIVKYAFNVLKVPYTSFQPINNNSSLPKEISLTFGSEINLKIIYLITNILKEIFDEELNVYIEYAASPNQERFNIVCGAYIYKDKEYTNASKHIKAGEILRLNIEDMDWKKFSRLFPNNNFSNDNTCRHKYTKIDIFGEEKDYEESDYESAMEEANKNLEYFDKCKQWDEDSNYAQYGEDFGERGVPFEGLDFS